MPNLNIVSKGTNLKSLVKFVLKISMKIIIIIIIMDNNDGGRVERTCIELSPTDSANFSHSRIASLERF